MGHTSRGSERRRRADSGQRPLIDTQEGGVNWRPSTIFLLIAMLSTAVAGLWLKSLVTMFASALIGAILLPRLALPAAALWLFTLLPVGYMGFPRAFGQYVTPAVVVVAVWMLRTAFAHRMAGLLKVPIRGWIIAAPLMLLLLLSAADTEDTEATIAWTAAFIICVIAPALLGQICTDDIWPVVRFAFAGIAFFIGFLAVIDVIAHFNPWTNVISVRLKTYQWSVFRAKTSLGHPLNTSLVGSVALGVCLFAAVEVRRKWPYLLASAFASGAVILSVARTGVFAVALAVLVGLVSLIFSGNQPNVRQHVSRGGGIIASLVLAGLLILAVVWSPLLKARNASSEAAGSTAVRSANLENVRGLVAERPILGFGPGSSSSVYADLYNRPLENSFLQLVVSIGLPSFALVLAGFCSLIAVAGLRSRASISAGLVAFLVSASGYNVIDINPAIFALISPLIVCAVIPPTKGRFDDAHVRPSSTGVNHRRLHGHGQSRPLGALNSP